MSPCLQNLNRAHLIYCGSPWYVAPSRPSTFTCQGCLLSSYEFARFRKNKRDTSKTTNFPVAYGMSTINLIFFLVLMPVSSRLKDGRRAHALSHIACMGVLLFFQRHGPEGSRWRAPLSFQGFHSMGTHCACGHCACGTPPLQSFFFVESNCPIMASPPSALNVLRQIVQTGLLFPLLLPLLRPALLSLSLPKCSHIAFLL